MRDRTLKSAVFLTDAPEALSEGAAFLAGAPIHVFEALHAVSRPVRLAKGDAVFLQGETHEGIYLIEQGQVRTFYTGPSGKEITLAYWTPGNFVGGPEIFGRGTHIWSAEAITPTTVRLLPGPALRRLASSEPAFALALIDGLIVKSKCYSSLVQILGTRSITERLAQFLLILADLEGGSDDVIRRKLSHDQIGGIIGSTRQWVTSTLTRFERAGVIRIDPSGIKLLRREALADILPAVRRANGSDRQSDRHSRHGGVSAQAAAE